MTKLTRVTFYWQEKCMSSKFWWKKIENSIISNNFVSKFFISLSYQLLWMFFFVIVIISMTHNCFEIHFSKCQLSFLFLNNRLKTWPKSILYTAFATRISNFDLQKKKILKYVSNCSYLPPWADFKSTQTFQVTQS